MLSQAERWMESIDKSGLPGKYKAWCYQHGILPRITWPLLMYEVPMTKVTQRRETLPRELNRKVTIQEINRVTKKNNKAMGTDLMPMEAIKHLHRKEKQRVCDWINEFQDLADRQAFVHLSLV